MKIGLALSGGGVRATVFHLGVLKRIADSPRWQDITFLSTVSGGSLCIALVFEKAGRCWPNAQTFSEQCLPEIRRLLTTCDLEGRYKKLLFIKPWLFLQGRASVIAKLIRELWGIASNVSQMPDPPRWEICATCYETGKSWRFSKKRMGDYLTNYVISPEFPLAEAAAASAAVPGLIGPLRVETAKYQWHRFAKTGNEPTIEVEPIASHLTLWDGGVYDNADKCLGRGVWWMRSATNSASRIAFEGGFELGGFVGRVLEPPDRKAPPKSQGARGFASGGPRNRPPRRA